MTPPAADTAGYVEWLRGQGQHDLAAELEASAARNGDGKKVSGSSDFVARQLARELATETPIAIGGGQLFVHHRGRYQPGAKQLRYRITEKLGNEWKLNKAKEILGYLQDGSPSLWLDPPTDRICFANGILDLDTGRLGPHDPQFLSPISIPVDYEPAARCHAIDTFLTDVLDVELAPVVYELLGYSLVPTQALQMAAMAVGGGANGKSTLLSVLTRVVGEDNVSSIALHKLEDDKFAPAGLYGKLLNVFGDLDARSLSASSMFKSIVGGDKIDGERKYTDPFSFRPYARLVFSANEPPPTPDSSDAFFRRWLILPFERRFDGSKADRNLFAKLTTPTELSGFVNLGLEALPDLMARGAFTKTKAGSAAADRFRIDSDSVAGFSEDHCEVGNGRIERSVLFRRYVEWCNDNGRRPLGAPRFNRHLQTLHPAIDLKTIKGTRYWSGIALGGDA